MQLSHEKRPYARHRCCPVTSTLLLTGLLVACEPTATTRTDESTSVTLEEAKNITAEFETPAFVPPSRTIHDVLEHIGPDRPAPPDCPKRWTAAVAKTLDDQSWGTRAFGDPANSFSWEPYLSSQDIRKISARKNYYLQLAQKESIKGNITVSVELLEEALRGLPKWWWGSRGDIQSLLARQYARVGDFVRADSALREAEGLYNLSRLKDPVSWKRRYKTFEFHNAIGKASVAYSKGLFSIAEGHFRTARHHRFGFTDTEWTAVYDLGEVSADLAQTLTRQGRFSEAEGEARKALLFRVGRTHKMAANVVNLAGVLYEQGRYAEAELLARRAVNIYESGCAIPGTVGLALAWRVLAKTLVAQERWEAAIGEYENIRNWMLPDSSDLFGHKFAGDVEFGLALLKENRLVEASETIGFAFERASERVGEDHEETARALGFLAMVHVAQGLTEEAFSEFQESVLTLERVWRAGAYQGAYVTTRSQHFRIIVEAYISLLVDARRPRARTSLDVDPLTEAFRLADIARSGTVQRAIAASRGRAAATNDELAGLVRREQDAQYQVGALQNALLTAMSQPAHHQNVDSIRQLRARIQQLSIAREALLLEVEHRFPDYAALVSPTPPSIEDVQSNLRPDEVLLAFLVGEKRTYVWAVPRRGAAAFTSVALGRERVRAVVSKLRDSLEPDAQTVGEIPQFDVSLAYELYAQLLKPVRAGWRDAGSLLVVPDGALGELPLSLLVTSADGVHQKQTPLFSKYRQVSWLAKKYPVTTVPSAASLVALRAGKADHGSSRAFAGFGDPWFSQEQAVAVRNAQVIKLARRETQASELALRRRGTPETRLLDSAELAKLPRLPDTAEEVLSIARALRADEKLDVFLGARASEKAVKTMDLSDRRVLAFATHGLVPGDLNGLTQPALALTSPVVTGDNEDGLLTLGEILGLRLNADWVVLSACNTAAAGGAGVEAVSGLGRAFFYAGARSLLVTHWPVETRSAKELTTTLFQLQSHNPSLTRAQALQQTMLTLIDEGGYRDERGRMLFSYAHPIFWAPFSLVGDGGRSRPDT